MKNWKYAAQLAVGGVLFSFTAASAQAESAGEGLYKAKCAACHGADGKGETAIGKKNMLKDLGSAEVQKLSDAEMTEIIANGKNKMPGYAKSLKPEQIKDLVVYLRTFAKK